MWEELENLTPVAKLIHTCQLCEWEIPPGTTYHRVSGIYDGDFHVYKAHPMCETVLRFTGWWEFDNDGSPDPSTFRDVLRHIETATRDDVTFKRYQLPTDLLYPIPFEPLDVLADH